MIQIHLLFRSSCKLLSGHKPGRTTCFLIWVVTTFMHPVHCSVHCSLVVDSGGKSTCETGAQAHPSLGDMQRSKWMTLLRSTAYTGSKAAPMPKVNLQWEGKITEAQFDFARNSWFASTTIDTILSLLRNMRWKRGRVDMSLTLATVQHKENNHHCSAWRRCMRELNLHVPVSFAGKSYLYGLLLLSFPSFQL